MKKFTKIALIGIVGFALVGCDDNDTPAPPAPSAPPAEVTYEALLDINMGDNGYKINVDINDSQDVYSGINYYICQDSKKGGYGYFAHDPSFENNGSWDLTHLPNFDHGYLVQGIGDGELEFQTQSGNFPTYYSVDNPGKILTKGQTYDFTLWDYYPDTGTIDIKSISDFNCSEITPTT